MLIRTLAAVATLAMVSVITAGASTADTTSAPAITYTVHATPGASLSVAWTVPGRPAMPLDSATVPASGTWTITVPADGWQGGLFGAPTLSAMVMGVSATSRPGIACSITQDGATLARDIEPAQYACLTSTDPAINR